MTEGAMNELQELALKFNLEIDFEWRRLATERGCWAMIVRASPRVEVRTFASTIEEAAERALPSLQVVFL